ncbi:hypothetical protein L211DRAFT_840942 [Terfezia boudieri ATCC MYA-4762]|uniref:Uncharacterized protein n=1 Tax=Terfezia boudieri ATCC MYA-4762 TaxID=1051890 RepID=A0A3N4LIB9_9PEZI|nr:hypothetical protein L211DRAFT_840942 [Terfezia boudieri ATCC MYA-4762]
MSWQLSGSPLQAGFVPTAVFSQSSHRKQPVDLASHYERDLRARTLTSLLAALSSVITVPPDDIVANSSNIFNDGSNVQHTHTTPSVATLTATARGPQRRSSRDESDMWLKLLNHIAQLLVREHEIVAVLPKRSGPTAHVNLVVATDSSNDDEDSADGYYITRNPRSKSPEHFPNSLGQLLSISTEDAMLNYLHTYRAVSFRNHVRGIEILYNAIVDSCNNYTTLLDEFHSDTRAGPVRLAQAHLSLRRRLLTLFVTFYSVGKMYRRFHSASFEKFRAVMSEMHQVDVEAAVQISSTHNPGVLFTNLEIDVFKSVLADPRVPARAYTRLSEIFDAAELSGKRSLYSKYTAWEIHCLLLLVLERAQAAVDSLYTDIACSSTTYIDISDALSNVRIWMARLQVIVHHSPSIASHMTALESILSPAMDGRVDVLNGNLAMDASTGDLDNDDGVTDTAIEISFACKDRRVGQECLWLAVRYQAALECLTAESALPKHPVSFTLCEVSAMGTSDTRTDLHRWRDVIISLYPLPSHDIVSASDVNISSSEAIATLEEYGQQARTRATHILRSPTHKFFGCCHAEAILGTLRHLSHLPGPAASLPRDIDLVPFQNTFCSIGVSKRCCPVSTKLLSLLGSSHSKNISLGHNQGTVTPRIIFSSHQNIYPTALPPYLPQETAVLLLEWLQGLLKSVVDRLVLKRRRLSAESQKSTKSSDSKGDSPAKHRGESGSDMYHMYSELGLPTTEVQGLDASV